VPQVITVQQEHSIQLNILVQLEHIHPSLITLKSLSAQSVLQASIARQMALQNHLANAKKGIIALLAVLLKCKKLAQQAHI